MVSEGAGGSGGGDRLWVGYWVLRHDSEFEERKKQDTQFT